MSTSHVYFVRSGALVKIGYSSNWFERVQQVMQGCPDIAETVLVLPGGRDHEKDLHERFAAARHRGEWFVLEGEVRRFIEEYATPDGLEALIAGDHGCVSMAW